MKRFNFSKIFFLLIFSLLLENINAMHESACENLSGSEEEICDALIPSAFENLPAELKLLILEKVIFASENLAAAFKNVIYFASVCSENRTIVKDSKALSCILTQKEDVEMGVKIIKKCKFAAIFEEFGFPKIFENGLYKLLKNSEYLKIIANLYDVKTENLKFFILFIAVTSNFHKFFELLFGENQQILDQEDLWLIFVLSKLFNKKILLDLMIKSNIKAYGKLDTSLEFMNLIKDKFKHLENTEKIKCIFNELSSKTKEYMLGNLNFCDYLAFLQTNFNFNNKDLFNYFKITILNSIYHSCLLKEFVHHNQNIELSFTDVLMLVLTPPNNNYEEIRNLPSNIFNIHTIDADESSILIHACCANSEKAVSFLLDKNVNINSQDKNGLTALIFAISLNLPNIVKLLLEHGADTSLTYNNGFTALDYAESQGYTEIVELLGAAQNKLDK